MLILFDKNSEIIQGVGVGWLGAGGGGVRVECQLRTSKSGACIDRGEEGCGVQNLDFFCECYK